MVAVITRRLLDGCSYVLEPAGWLLSFLGACRIVAVISWRVLDGCWMLKKSPSSLEGPTTTAGTLSVVLER